MTSQKGMLTPEGGGKYENQLALVGLDGHVPGDLALALMEAQQVRNVWAHNGGRADKKLLSQCPNIGAALGEKIAMHGDRLAKYVAAQNTYTTIVMNRARTRCGLRPMKCYGGRANIFKTSFAQQFPDAAPTHELIETLKAERAAEESGGGGGITQYQETRLPKSPLSPRCTPSSTSSARSSNSPHQRSAASSSPTGCTTGAMT